MEPNKYYAIPADADPLVVVKHRRRLYVWVLVAVMVLAVLLFTLRNDATVVAPVLDTVPVVQTDADRLREVIQTVPEPTTEQIDRLREMMQAASDSIEVDETTE
jgi:hypothetical protein